MAAANQLAAWEEGILPVGTAGSVGRAALSCSALRSASAAVRGSVGCLSREGANSEVTSLVDLGEGLLGEPGLRVSARTTKGLGLPTAFFIVRQTQWSPIGKIIASKAK